MKLRIDAPPDNLLHDLAPRVEGIGGWRGEYGYALALTSDGKVRVLWDHIGVQDADSESVLFLHFGNQGR